MPRKHKKSLSQKLEIFQPPENEKSKKISICEFGTMLATIDNIELKQLHGRIFLLYIWKLMGTYKDKYEKRMIHSLYKILYEKENVIMTNLYNYDNQEN